MGVEPYLIGAALDIVLAQRLVRKICTACKEPVEPPAAMQRAVERLIGRIDTFYHGVGCNKCRNTGFSGRIGLFEMFVPSEELLEAISRGAQLLELRELASRTDGYTSLGHDGMTKVKAGLTTVEEVFYATVA